MPPSYLVGSPKIVGSMAQRAALRAAFFPPYNPIVRHLYAPNDVAGASYNDVTWKPLINLGPNRLVVAGTVHTWDPRMSCGPNWGKVDFTAADTIMNWGDGTIENPPSSYTTEGGTGVSFVGQQFTHTYATEGMYKISLTASHLGQSQTVYRYVKVIPSWSEFFYDSTAYGITQISNLSGSLSAGGWQATITVLAATSAVDTGPAGEIINIAPFTVVQLYADAYYPYLEPLTGSATTKYVEQGDDTHARNYAGAENYLGDNFLTGYIVGSSISQDSESQTFTFTIRSPEYYLQNMQHYIVNYWNQDIFPQTNNKWGWYIAGLQPQDVIADLLTDKSDFAEWHDVLIDYDNVTESHDDGTPRDISDPTGDFGGSGDIVQALSANEGSFWQSIQDLTNNFFGLTYCDRAGGLHCVRNPNLASDLWWAKQSRPVISFTRDLLTGLQIQVSAGADGAAINRYTGDGHFGLLKVSSVQINAVTSFNSAIVANWPWAASPNPAITTSQISAYAATYAASAVLPGTTGLENAVQAYVNTNYRLPNTTLDFTNYLVAINYLVYSAGLPTLTGQFPPTPNIGYTPNLVITADQIRAAATLVAMDPTIVQAFVNEIHWLPAVPADLTAWLAQKGYTSTQTIWQPIIGYASPTVPAFASSLGSWDIKQGVLTDSQLWLAHLAWMMFLWDNNPYSGTATTGLIQALDVGSLVTITGVAKSTFEAGFPADGQGNLVVPSWSGATNRPLVLIQSSQVDIDVEKSVVKTSFGIEVINRITYNENDQTYGAFQEGGGISSIGPADESVIGRVYPTP